MKKTAVFFLLLVMALAGRAWAHPLDQIAQATAQGTLDEETRLRYLILAIYDPQALPPEFHDDRPTRLMTPALVELNKRYATMSAENKALLARYGVGGRRALSHEPVLSGPLASLGVGNYKIFYTTTGEDAVTTTYLNDLASVLQQVVQAENTTMGFPRPIAESGGLYPIYISHARTGGRGVFGYVAVNSKARDNPHTTQVETDAYSSHLVLDNDYLDFGNESPATSLRTTLAHEHFHSIQMGMTLFDTYDPFVEKTDVRWLAEATATWMERMVFPSIDQAFRIYSEDATNYTEYGPFWIGSTFNNEYAGFLFFEYFHNRDTNASTVLRQVYETASAQGGQTVSPLVHFKQKLEAAGTVGTIKTYLGDYAWSLLFRTASLNGSTSRYTYSMTSGFGVMATETTMMNLTATYTGGAQQTVGTQNVTGSGSSFSRLQMDQAGQVTFSTTSSAAAGSEMVVQWFRPDGVQNVFGSTARASLTGVFGEEKTITPNSPATFSLSPGKYFFRVLNPSYQPVPQTNLAYTLAILPIPPADHPGVVCIRRASDPNTCPDTPPDLKLVAAAHEVKIVWDPRGGEGLQSVNIEYEGLSSYSGIKGDCTVTPGAVWTPGNYDYLERIITGTLAFSSPATQATELIRCPYTNARLWEKGTAKLSATRAFGASGGELLIDLVNASVEYVQRECPLPTAPAQLQVTPTTVNGLAVCSLSWSLPADLANGGNCGLTTGTTSSSPFTLRWVGEYGQTEQNFDSAISTYDINTVFGFNSAPSLTIKTEGGVLTPLLANCLVPDPDPFFPNTGYTTLNKMKDLIVGDMDGDGRPDGASASFSNGVMTTFINQKGGTFGVLQTMSGATHQFNDISAGDINNDGALDLLLSGFYGDIRAYLGNGSGSFSTGWRGDYDYAKAMALGDADNDGDLDLWLGNEYFSSNPDQMLSNQGDGTFAVAYTSPVSENTTDVEWRDINKDGLLDALTSEYAGYLTIYVNNGNGFSEQAFQSNTNFSGFDTVDVNGDGYLDVVAMANSLLLFVNQAGGYSDSVDLGIECFYPRGGDLDNDGDMDLLCRQSGAVQGKPEFAIYKNVGPGVFTKTFAKTIEEYEGYHPELADMDLDGDLDIVAGHSDYGLTWFKNNWAGANAPPPRPVMNPAVADTAANTVTFSWSPGGADDHSGNNLISYHLRIGTRPGGDEVKSGYWSPGPGNVGNTLSWTLKNPPTGTLFYSVRAIDGALSPSPWSLERNTGGYVINCRVAGSGGDGLGPRPNLADAVALADVLGGAAATPCANRGCDYDGSGNSIPDAADLALLAAWVVGDDPEGVCATTAARAAAGNP